MASSFFGRPRSTVDLDFAIDVPQAAGEALIEDLKSVFYVPAEAARRAIEESGSFNVLLEGGVLKVDLFVLGSDQLDRWQIERRVPVELPEFDLVLWVSAPGEQVLRKLQWFRAGGERSDRQWNDVLGILQTSGPDIDIDRLRQDATALHLEDLLDQILAQAGLR
jgi:hypothetical protein